MGENHTRVLSNGRFGSVPVWLGSLEIGVLRVPLCSVVIVPGRWLTDVNVGLCLYCHQLWSHWGWREEQVASKCQDVCLERRAVGRWDRGMLPSTLFLGGKVANRAGTACLLESAPEKLVEPNWTELQYFSTVLALALLIALDFNFFFLTFFPPSTISCLLTSLASRFIY